MSPSSARRLYLVAFALVSATVLAGQIVLSRLLSTTIGYDYAFVLVSLAMLGLGSGGLIVQQLPNVFTRERLEKQAALLALAMGASCFVGVLVMLQLYPGLAFGASFFVVAGIFWSFFPFCLFAGTLVSLVLYHAKERFHVVYGVDLTAAACGCLIAVLSLATLSPVDVMLKVIVLLPLAASALFALSGQHRTLSFSALGCCALVAVGGATLLPYPHVSDPQHITHYGRRRVLSQWNSVSNVTAYPGPFYTWSLSPAYRGPRFPMLDLVIDGQGGTEIVRFTGKAEDLRHYQYLDEDLTALGQVLTPKSGRQLIIGPGGGVDILQGVRRGRTDITAVEINPLVARVVNEDLAQYSGKPYELPGVKVRIENGRTFIKRSDERWDLVSLTWVDTGGSAQAMAFSEYYLYTVESYTEFMQHLTPNGYFAFMRALGVAPDLSIDTIRGISVAVEALRRLGVADPSRQILVAGSQSPFFFNRPMCYVLVKRSPFTDGELTEARAFLGRLGFQALWLPGGGPDPASMPKPYAEFAPTVQEIITTRNPEALYEEARFDVAPTSDDSPFYFIERSGPNRKGGASLKRLGLCVASLLVVGVPFLGVPMIPLIRRRQRMGKRGAAALAYFSLLGLAFMLVEIEMFQIFALLLGNPVYALSTVLGSLLIFSGLGSLQAGRLSQGSPRAKLMAFGLLVALLAIFSIFKGAILGSLIVASFPVRVLATIALLAPIAFCMGLPMATGMRLVEDRGDLVLWGWALNGFCSVLAGVLAIFLAIHIGISRTVAIGVACYLIAGLLVHVLPTPESTRSKAVG